MGLACRRTDNHAGVGICHTQRELWAAAQYKENFGPVALLSLGTMAVKVGICRGGSCMR